MNRYKSSLTLGLVVFSSLLLFAQHPPSTSRKEALVLNGLDPIALVQGKKEKGQETHSAVFEGFRYYFANAKNKEAFQSQPDKYAVYPMDVVAKTRLNQEFEGKPDVFAVHQGRIFLFVSEDARDVFEKNPNEFAGAEREGSGPAYGPPRAPEGSAPKK